MRFGIDFGTTHTVVALIDRGNYPIVSFEQGDAIPSVVSADAEGGLHFGHTEPGWTAVRSFKRLLGDAHPDSEVSLGPVTLPLADLLAGFLSHVREEILAHSNAGLRKKDAVEAAVSVPANASTAQRLMTMDAYRRAGFDVKAVLNEPSAAGFEYAHRFRETVTSKREYVLVYDLGGGTFDASLIHM
ncbi:MAG TPA: Hsp70 family protein, partial [Myxococcales bacterium]